MDENLIDKTIEEYDVTEDIEIQTIDVPVEDIDDEVVADETEYDVVVEPEEEVVIDISESMGWVSGDDRYHDSLLGIDAPNQHPMTAITGLREELNEIERLKTVYSDKINVANYYEWEDGAYDEHGYFVSIVPGTSKIKVCEGADIFGVSVDVAGFIGGQDETVPRNNSYGLIATSGLVDVRCELDVEVGDYVISDERGFARKSGSNYGYKVLAKETKNGIEYAVIMLGVQADVANCIGIDLTQLRSVVDIHDKNIVSAINVANQAYNKSMEACESSSVSEEAVKEALESILKSEEKIEEFEQIVGNASATSAQAKAIAESAATSAASMKNEAIAEANKAIDETSKLRQELESRVTEIDAELDNTALELEETKERFNTSINDLRLDTDGQLADFKKEVEDNYATTTQLAAVKTENSDAVAALKQEVSDTYATTESVTSLKTETKEALTGFKQEVSETYATQEMLTSLETETSKALTDYKQEVTNTYATQEMVTTLETNTSKALADYKQEVQDDYATQETVTKLEKDTSKALSDYKQEVTDTYATQASLTTLRTDTTNAIAASEEKATSTYASKNDLTSFESDTNTAMARIEQKADTNGAYIQSTVSNMDKYAVGPYSQAYGFTLEQAASVLEVGMMYVPTSHEDLEAATPYHTETYKYDDNRQTYERTFTPGYLYKWCQLNGGHYGWITVDKNYNETTEENMSSVAVYFTTTEPVVSDNFGYWYTNGDTITSTTGTYEPYTLYKWESYVGENDTTQYHWVAVATLAGNSSNRAVSNIRQDTNSIELRVTSTEGSAASSKQWIDENSTNIQDVVSWKRDNGESLVTFMQTADENYASASQVAKIVDKDGNIIESSIVTAVNNNASSISLSADSIEFTGQKLNIKVDATNIDGTLVIGQLPETVAEMSDIPTKTSDLTNDSDFQDKSGVVTIAKGTITADYIKTLNLEVGNEIKMGDNATISWNKIDNKPDNIATTDDIPNTDDIKQVTRTVITSETIEAPYLKVNAANITGTLTVQNSSNYTLLEAGGNVVKIGDFTVGKNSTKSYIYTGKTSYNDTKSGVYLGTDGIGLGSGKFYVTDTGDLTSKSGTIGGWSISENSITKGHAGMLSSDGLKFFAGKGVQKSPTYRRQIYATQNDGETYIAVNGTSSGLDFDDVLEVSLSVILYGDEISIPCTAGTDFEYKVEDDVLYIKFISEELVGQRLTYIVSFLYISNNVEHSAFRVYDDGTVSIAGWESVTSDEVPASGISGVSNGALYNSFATNSAWGGLKSGDASVMYLYKTYLIGAGVVVEAFVYDVNTNTIGESKGTMSMSWSQILSELGGTFSN